MDYLQVVHSLNFQFYYIPALNNNQYYISSSYNDSYRVSVFTGNETRNRYLLQSQRLREEQTTRQPKATSQKIRREWQLWPQPNPQRKAYHTILIQCVIRGM